MLGEYVAIVEMDFGYRRLGHQVENIGAGAPKPCDSNSKARDLGVTEIIFAPGFGKVELRLDETLGVTVSDNGRGIVEPAGNGVGWTSMTERAAELGGTCRISARPAGGVVVRALLPLREDAGVGFVP